MGCAGPHRRCVGMDWNTFWTSTGLRNDAGKLGGFHCMTKQNT